MALGKKRSKIEYGDFQTPASLAYQVCNLIAQTGCAPQSILEPTCGVGHFLDAALQSFPSVRYLAGVEINPEYVSTAKLTLEHLAVARPDVTIDISVSNFFDKEWESYLANLPDPILIIGNPPWVTNAEVGTLNGGNLPQKHNSQNLPGLDALTGASNFDISEWMLLRILEWIEGRNGVVAMLCKTSVARKVLLANWKNRRPIANSRLYKFDSQSTFGVSVDACLLVCDNTVNPICQKENETECYIYETLTDSEPSGHIGYRKGVLVSDIERFEKWRHLLASPKSKQEYVWRSGIKHDATNVMELQKVENGYQNRLSEKVLLEDDYLYPMLKSSDIAGQSTREPRFWMLVPQRRTGEETASIQLTAPNTWRYLTNHARILDGRKSAIYRNRPRYSIFGVGGYSFAPWKVAISGMYKGLRFQVIGKFDEKPIVLDDTCYFLSCATQAEAEFIAGLLNSEIAQQFFRAFIFWDEKRPITVRLLRKLSISKVADELGVSAALAAFSSKGYQNTNHTQLQLFEKPV